MSTSVRLVKLLPVAAALALGGFAQARDAQEPPSVIVKFGDLNLNTRAGVAKLHTRLRNAAEHVCSQLDTRVLGLRDQFDQCVSDAMGRAVNDVDNPNLSLYHRYGRKADILASS